MVATNNFARHQSTDRSPYSHGAAITPHDTNELTNVTRGIYVGGAGNVKVTTVDGDTITYVAVPVGTTLDVQAKIVFATLTTATNLLALW